MKILDRFLDRITMYRLTLYYLILLVAAAIGLSFLGYLPYKPFVVMFDALYLTLACWFINRVFAYLLRLPHNPESSLITALILSLLITPQSSPHNLIFLSAAAGLAIASKYILIFRGQHIFNPAALAVVLTAFGARQSASWWVGNAYLVPIVVVGGLLVMRKLRRGRMVGAFLLTALLATTFLTLLHSSNALPTIRATLLHSSLFFLAFVMLTEPLTSPTTTGPQGWYALVVGLLFPPQVHIFQFYSTPELALVIGNLFAFIIAPRTKLTPRLAKKINWGPSVKDFVFALDRPLSYQPGQYMEFTLPHSEPDNRGSRRYFTLASSPTENNLRLGVKFYEHGSSFKQAMLTMHQNTSMAAGQLGGDFTLPKDSARKLVFIAGGIGITPYRSMIKYLLDTNDKRSVTLLYSERTAQDLAYYDVFNEAYQKLGAKIVYTLTDEGTPLPQGVRAGRITPDLIKAEVPDYMDRLFYISGPHSMVTAMKGELLQMDVSRRNIKTDFFPGYA